MEAIREKLNPLEKKGTLKKSIDDIQAAIDALTKAKDKIQHGKLQDEVYSVIYAHTTA